MGREEPVQRHEPLFSPDALVVRKSVVVTQQAAVARAAPAAAPGVAGTLAAGGARAAANQSRCPAGPRHRFGLALAGSTRRLGRGVVAALEVLHAGRRRRGAAGMEVGTVAGSTDGRRHARAI